VKRVALAIVIALAGVAHADEPLADQKFDQAQKLRDAGKIAESCALFRESLQLNPNAIGTLLNVARCDEEQGKIASAVRAFTDARDRAAEQNLTPQRDAAEEHLHALVDRVPHLALAFAAELPPGAQIAVDDRAVDPSTAGDVLVDPGSVHVVVAAPGYVAFETHVEVAERGHKAVVIPKLAPPVVVKNPRRLVGKILTFVGAGTFVASVGLGIGAKVDYDKQINGSGCTLHGGVETCMPDTSNHANNDHTLGNLATGIAIGGIAVAVAGAALWFFSPTREQRPYPTVAPVLAPGQAGVTALWVF
jgi:hypothetical protein